MGMGFWCMRVCEWDIEPTKNRRKNNNNNKKHKRLITRQQQANDVAADDDDNDFGHNNKTRYSFSHTHTGRLIVSEEARGSGRRKIKRKQVYQRWNKI